MPSASQCEQEIDKFLASECAEGRILGPFDGGFVPAVHVNRLGAIPKTTVVDTVVQTILQLGRGALLAKMDIRNAYRNISVHQEDRWLLGMSWRGGVFIDTVLSFSLRSAPNIFNAVADALEWVV